MYRAILSITLVDLTGVTILLKQELDLPFPPVVGIEIGTSSPRCPRGDVIQSVLWDTKEKCFHCELADWIDGQLTMEQMLEDFGPEWRRIVQESRTLRVVSE